MEAEVLLEFWGKSSSRSMVTFHFRFSIVFHNGFWVDDRIRFSVFLYCVCDYIAMEMQIEAEIMSSRYAEQLINWDDFPVGDMAQQPCVYALFIGVCFTGCLISEQLHESTNNIISTFSFFVRSISLFDQWIMHTHTQNNFHFHSLRATTMPTMHALLH